MEVLRMMESSTYTWDLVSALELTSLAFCKTPAALIDSICTNIQPGKIKESRNDVLYCVGLHKQNPGLREVDLKPSLKKSSDKINILKQRKKTQKKASHTVQAGLRYGSHHLER